MAIKTIADWQMNYATGLEEDDIGIIPDNREEESQEHISQTIDDSTLVETESDINYAQSGELTYNKKPAMLFSSRQARSDIVGPKKPQTAKYRPS